MALPLISALMLLFAVFALSRLILRRKDRSIPLVDFIFWAVIWLAVIALVLFPNLMSLAASTTGIGRAVDLIIYLSVITLFYLIFRMNVKMERHSQEMTRLIRESAIARAEREDLRHAALEAKKAPRKKKR